MRGCVADTLGVAFIWGEYLPLNDKKNPLWLIQGFSQRKVAKVTIFEGIFFFGHTKRIGFNQCWAIL
jgi:hypothetical protein